MPDFPPYDTDLSRLIDQLEEAIENPNLTVTREDMARLLNTLRRLAHKQEHAA